MICDLESLFKIVQGQIGKGRKINSGPVLISSEQTSLANVGRQYCSRDIGALEVGLTAEYIDDRGTRRNTR